jgi:protein SCO1/2
MTLILLGSIAVLWVGLIAAAKWADHALNDGRKPPSVDSIIQNISVDNATTLPSYWDVPAFSFLDQDGKTVTDRDLRGHVWVADFIFTQCTTACPIMTSKMLILQKQVHQPGARFISFSVDPEHDTPAALKAYAELWHGDQARWRLLSTDHSRLMQLIKAMHVTVEATEDKDNPIMHSSIFQLVDAAGHVRGIYDSIDSEATAKLADDMNILAGASTITMPAATQPSTDSPAGRGLLVYQSMGCLACHSQPRVAPPLAAMYGGQVRLADHRTIWADEAYVHESIVEPNAKVVAGYLPTMPSYRGLLTDDQVADLVAYIKSLSTNPAGGHGVVSDVAATQPEQELLVTDPVCKMDVHIDPTAPHAVFNGKTYYFCSDHCRDEFLKNLSHYSP